MIRKLLFVFSIVLGTVGIGWGQTTVTTEVALKDAITAAGNGTTITLGANIPLTKNLMIEGKTGVTIDGKGFTLAKTIVSGAANDNFITLKNSPSVTLKDITLNDSTNGTKQPKSGLHVYTSASVTLTNVSITNFGAAGLIVNGSTVTATGLTTKGNAWGGIEVAKGVDVTTDPALTLTSSIITEPAQIWADKADAPASWVKSTGWTSKVVDKQTFWTNRNITVSTAIELKSAVASIGNDGTITLGANITLTENLWFEGKEGVTIDGKGFTLAKTIVSGAANDNFITLKNSPNVTLKDITLNDATSGTKQAKSGLHVYTSAGVTLTNVSITNFGAAGLIVNGSTVTATELTTKGNAWGGINVDKGVGVTQAPSLTLTSSAITEPAQIWSDKTADVASWVGASEWTMKVITLEGKTAQTFWTSSKQNTTVSTAAELMTAAALVNDGGKITLGANIILTEKLWFEGKKNLTIDGGNFTLTKTITSGTVDNFVTLKSCPNVTLENIKLNDATSGTKQAKSGLHVYTSADVILNNVSITNFGAAGLIVNGSTVTASGLTTNGNAWGGIEVAQGVDVKQVPKLTLTNSAITETIAQIWSDKAADDVANWVSAPGWSMTVKDGKTFWSQKAVAPVLTAPTASTIEAGQSLSLSMLTGGSAKVTDVAISGLFAWKNPADTASIAKSKYTVVFTPTDLTKYAVAEINVEIKNIEQFYIVTVGKSANGKVIVSPANAANKYAAGTTLTLTNEAEPNYKFLKLLGGATASYKVTNDDVLTAEFAPILHTVTIATTDGGSVNINGTKKENAATVSVQQGSSLSVVAVPGSGNVLKSLTCNNSKVISNGTVTVDKPFAITAAFEAIPASKFAVNTTITGNGKLLLFDASGNAIPAGSAVAAGDISVLAVADQGYAAGAISGATITDGKCNITAATTLSVEFKKQTYAVTTSTVTGATIAITGNGSNALTAVPFGSELTANVTQTAEQAKTHRLLSLLVNGKEIPNGGKFTVTAATEVKAVMRKLAELNIDKAAQTVVYDATAKAFVVKTTPAGVSGFTVTYGSNAIPTTAGDYTVTIKRAADDVYAAVNITDAKLVIEQAEMKVPEPTFGTNKELVTDATNGKYAWGDGGQGSESAIKEVTFTPADKNYKLVTFSVWNNVGVAPETVNIPVQTRSGLRADANSLVVNATGGTVEVLNGTTPATTMYVGQTLTLKAIPAAGNSAKATWATGNATSIGETTTITLTEGVNTVKATFAAKSAPVAPTINPTSAAYTGAAFGGVTPVAASSGWNIVFKQGETTIPAPTNAGTYAVFASYPADEFSAAVTDKNIGTFTITPVAATAAVKSATAILAGQSLAQSIITGTSDVDGTFEWVSPNTILTATAPSQSVVFVPKSANYTAPSGGMATSVTVTSTGVTLRTLNLTVTNPDKGTVTMKLNGAEVASGAMVTKGDKLTVTFAATAAGYTASATIAGVAYTSGATYTVAETGNVDVKVSYTINDSSSEVPSTGVSLNATTKTLAVGAEFTLVATVAPTSATSTGVSWASSDPTIATVDANGKVKALKAGTCKITVTTTEGGFTASCDVTVSLPTGIEEILANSRVYTRSGMICIDPAHPVDVVVVNMAGVMVYRDQLTDSRQISVSGGIYMVQLSDGKQVATVKVFVR